MKKFIGIDIGGTNTKIGLVNAAGEISHLSRVYYSDSISSATGFFNEVIPVIENILIETEVCGIGVSTPGLLMENRHGPIYSLNLPFLSGFDIVSLIERKFGVPVRLENDLVANGLAAYHFGSDCEIDRFLSVAMGTGIGHVFILNGKTVESIGGISGDSGRMILDPNSVYKDASGISGSAEALCGVGMIETLAAETWKGNAPKTAFEVITLYREENDYNAVRIMNTVAHWLAVYLVNLSSIYFPYVISISGGQTEAGDAFLESCRKEYERLSAGFFMPGNFNPHRSGTVEIKKSQAGGLSGLLGTIVSFILQA